MNPFILKVVLLEREAEEIKRREQDSFDIHAILVRLAFWATKKEARKISADETHHSLFLKDCATGCE